MLVYILENYLLELRTQCLDDMSSLTSALFLRLHIWKVVPLGVYGWTHALSGCGGWGGGGLSCFAHLVCAILHGIGLWDIQS